MITFNRRERSSLAEYAVTVKKPEVDTRGDRKRIKTLEKELNRKEKALAETAALLVLREKCNALWEKDEEQ